MLIRCPAGNAPATDVTVPSPAKTGTTWQKVTRDATTTATTAALPRPAGSSPPTLIDELERDADGRRALCELRSDPQRVVSRTMMYSLLDVERSRCLTLIREVAAEDTLEGLAARMNLPTILAKGGPHEAPEGRPDAAATPDE